MLLFGFHDLLSRLGEVLLILHEAFDLAYGILVPGYLHLFVEVYLLSSLAACEIQQLHLAVEHLELDTQAREALENIDSVGEPHGSREEVVILLLETDVLQHRRTHARDLLLRKIDVGDAQQVRIELTPQGNHVVVLRRERVQLPSEILCGVLRLLHFGTQGRLLTLDRRERLLPHFQLFSEFAQRGLVILEFYSHSV